MISIQSSLSLMLVPLGSAAGFQACQRTVYTHAGVRGVGSASVCNAMSWLVKLLDVMKQTIWCVAVAEKADAGRSLPRPVSVRKMSNSGYPTRSWIFLDGPVFDSIRVAIRVIRHHQEVGRCVQEKELDVLFSICRTRRHPAVGTY